MFKGVLKLTACICTAAFISGIVSFQASADEYEDYRIEGLNEVTRTEYMLKAQKSGIVVRNAADEGAEPVATLSKGSVYEVVETGTEGWARVSLAGEEGYVSTDNGVLVYETASSEVDEKMQTRQDIVRYALSFVGNSYVWGGTDPHTGVDCSGFTRYIIANAAGVSLPHSSGGQAGQGRTVSEDELKPGDLVFYGDGSIDHVGIYMGDGMVVHASSAKTGIKVSPVFYRTPVKYVSVL